MPIGNSMKTLSKNIAILLLAAVPFYANAYQTFTPAGAMDVNYCVSESLKKTYSVAVAGITPAALATDVLTITGSAAKTIRINRIEITADATAASVIDFYIFKRSTLDTSGTFTPPSSIPNDSANPAATATLKLYSANPTLGAGVVIRATHFALPAITASSFSNAPWTEDFGNRNDQQIVLHGVNESIAVSMNGQTIPAGFNGHIMIEWTEE